MLYQFPTCGGLKFKILCAIWECQSFTKEKKGLGKIPHLSLVAKPLVTHGEFYFSPLVASPLRGEKSNPFFSSVKDWVIQTIVGYCAPDKHFIMSAEFDENLSQ